MQFRNIAVQYEVNNLSKIITYIERSNLQSITICLEECCRMDVLMQESFEVFRILIRKQCSSFEIIIKRIHTDLCENTSVRNLALTQLIWVLCRSDVLLLLTSVSTGLFQCNKPNDECSLYNTFVFIFAYLMKM